MGIALEMNYLCLRSNLDEYEITEQTMLEGTSEDHLGHQYPAQRSVEESRTGSCQILNISRDQDSTISQGNQFQCLTNLTIK